MCVVGADGGNERKCMEKGEERCVVVNKSLGKKERIGTKKVGKKVYKEIRTMGK